MQTGISQRRLQRAVGVNGSDTHWLRNAKRYLITTRTARGRLDSSSFSLSTQALLSSIPTPARTREKGFCIKHTRHCCFLV